MRQVVKYYGTCSGSRRDVPCSLARSRNRGGGRQDAQLKAVIKDPEIVTPTGKFNVDNTQHDIY